MTSTSSTVTATDTAANKARISRSSEGEDDARNCYCVSDPTVRSVGLHVQRGLPRFQIQADEDTGETATVASRNRHAAEPCGIEH